MTSDGIGTTPVLPENYRKRRDENGGGGAIAFISIDSRAFVGDGTPEKPLRCGYTFDSLIPYSNIFGWCEPDSLVDVYNNPEYAPEEPSVPLFMTHDDGTHTYFMAAPKPTDYPASDIPVRQIKLSEHQGKLGIWVVNRLEDSIYFMDPEGNSKDYPKINQNPQEEGFAYPIATLSQISLIGAEQYFAAINNNPPANFLNLLHSLIPMNKPFFIPAQTTAKNFVTDIFSWGLSDGGGNAE